MTRSIPGVLGLALVLLVNTSQADDAAKDSARVRARTLAQRGDDAFSAGRCDQAIPLWNQAEATFHAPTIQLRIANCYALLGKVVQATRLMTDIVNEELPPDAPDAFRTAREQAIAGLPNVRARIGTLEVIIDVPSSGTKPRVFVDDQSLPSGTTQLEVDPGSHRVRVEAGDALWVKTVTVKEHGHEKVQATIEQEVPPPPPRPQRTVGLVLGGVGLATAAVGSYFGVRALRTSGELKDICGPRLDDCPSDRQADIDQVGRDSKIADVTMATGGVLFLAGAVIMVTESPAQREAPTLRVVPVGLGGGVQGVF
jgi:hypothetical protein